MKINKLNEKGLAPLYLRIIQKRRTKFIAIGVYLKPEEWNEKTERVRTRHPNSARINALIAQRIAEAQGTIVDLETKSRSVSAERIKELIKDKPPVNFFEYAEKYIQSLANTEKIGSYRRAKAVINKLKVYKNQQPLFLGDITVSFLKDYQEYLRSNSNNCQNTIHANFRVIRKIINDAIREDIITHNENPFYKFPMKTEKTSREYLNEVELKKIEDLDLPKNTLLYHHRNLYVFATYSGGLRVSDLLTLKWLNFDGERIKITIHKTNTPLTIKLPNKALAIINIYKKVKLNPNDFIFPLFDNTLDYSNAKILHNSINAATTYINKNLKLIAFEAKLKKKISFHTSRHTFATLALQKGIRVEYVSKLLGHSNIRETQIYAKIVNQELDKAMEVFNV